MNQQATASTQKIDVKGRQLVAKIKELVREGNVRRVVVKDTEGKTIAEVPVTVGVLGLIAAPSMAAIGAVVAFAADYSIEVDRNDVESIDRGPIPAPAEEREIEDANYE